MAANGKWFFGTQEPSTYFLHMDYASGALTDQWNSLYDIWKVNKMEMAKLELISSDGTKMLTLSHPIR